MKELTKKKVLVVGAGYMGKVHARAYKNIRGADLAAVADLDAGRALDFFAGIWL